MQRARHRVVHWKNTCAPRRAFQRQRAPVRRRIRRPRRRRARRLAAVVDVVAAPSRWPPARPGHLIGPRRFARDDRPNILNAVAIPAPLRAPSPPLCSYILLLLLLLLLLRHTARQHYNNNNM